MWIVSGVFFSAQRFPDFAQPIDQGAAAHGAASTRCARFSCEAPASRTSASSSAILGGWLVVAFVAGLKLFRWR